MSNFARDLENLKSIVRDVAALNAANAVLSWDQETYMPPGGAASRAGHRAALARMAHQKFTSDEVGRLLETLQGQWDPDDDSFDALYVRHAAERFARSRKLPARLVEEIAQQSSLAKDAWVRARAEDDFAAFAPHLERLVALTIEKAEHLGYEDDRYDALLDSYEPEMPTAAVERVFSELKERLVPLVARVAEADGADGAFMGLDYDEDAQWELGMEALALIGYDLERGRQDVSAHPFTTSFSPSDVRITTRIRRDDWASGFFATLHEAGHGIHGQGIPEALAGTPLLWRRSLGVSESQSLLWENIIGRSREFWEHFLPVMQRRFPEQTGSVSLDEFYRAINRVTPSLIRVEADELTYNLHIFVRFDLEQKLVAEKLDVKDLPEAWRAKMDEYLGVTPDTDTEGVLQDIHWSMGAFGYFPTYTLGNVLSVQFYEQALRDHPEIPAETRAGRFDTLRVWTNEKIHRHGSIYTPMELVRRVTGTGLDSGPYLNYLERKYKHIYRL